MNLDNWIMKDVEDNVLCLTKKYAEPRRVYLWFSTVGGVDVVVTNTAYLLRILLEVLFMQLWGIKYVHTMINRPLTTFSMILPMRRGRLHWANLRCGFHHTQNAHLALALESALPSRRRMIISSVRISTKGYYSGAGGRGIFNPGEVVLL
jgi:hypothetical protein